MRIRADNSGTILLVRGSTWVALIACVTPTPDDVWAVAPRFLNLRAED